MIKFRNKIDFEEKIAKHTYILGKLKDEGFFGISGKKKPLGSGTGAGAAKRAREEQERIIKEREAKLAKQKQEDDLKAAKLASSRRKSRKQDSGLAGLLSKDTGFTGVLGGKKNKLGGKNV